MIRGLQIPLAVLVTVSMGYVGAKPARSAESLEETLRTLRDQDQAAAVPFPTQSRNPLS